MFCCRGYYIKFIFWPFSTDILAFWELHWILCSLKSIKVKDCVKVASRKLVNRCHEFAISFAKVVGMVKWVKYNIRVQHDVVFLWLSLFWGLVTFYILIAIWCYFASLRIDILVFFSGYSLRCLSLKLQISIKLLLLYKVHGIHALALRNILFILARQTMALNLWRKPCGCEKLNKRDFKLLSLCFFHLKFVFRFAELKILPRPFHFLCMFHQIHNLQSCSKGKEISFGLTTFAPIVSTHPYCACKFTCHIMHQACALSTKLNNDRADGHCYSLAWI